MKKYLLGRFAHLSQCLAHYLLVKGSGLKNNLIGSYWLPSHDSGQIRYQLFDYLFSYEKTN